MGFAFAGAVVVAVVLFAWFAVLEGYCLQVAESFETITTVVAGEDDYCVVAHGGVRNSV